MDYFGVPRGSLRQEALSKLGDLAVHELALSTGTTNDDFNKLMLSVQLLNVAMGNREFETLVGLCNACATPISRADHVEELIAKFKLYFLELPGQRFSGLINLRTEIALPWLYLGEKLTVALIALAGQCDRMYRTEVVDIFREFQDRVFGDKLELSHYFCLLGYMQGLTIDAGFLGEDAATLKLLTNLDAKIDNYEFLQEAETYSNRIYSEQELHDYAVFLDRDIAGDFSPILYLEYLLMVMCNVVSACLVKPAKTEAKDSDSTEGEATKTGSRPTASTPETPKGSYDTRGLLFGLLEQVLELYETDDSVGVNVLLFHMDMIKALADVAIAKLEFLDRGEAYIVYLTYNRLRLGYLTKLYCLQIVACGMFCDQVELKVARKLFKNCLEIKDVMLDPDLGLTALELGLLLVFKDDLVGSSLTRAFTALAANPNFEVEYCMEALKAVGLALRVLSQDAVITTIYALTNLLFVDGDGTGLRRKNTHLLRVDLNRLGRTATHTLHLAGAGAGANEDDYETVCENLINGIVEICQGCGDETVATLAVTILLQKTLHLDLEIGPLLLKGLVLVAPHLPTKEFVLLMRLVHRLALDALADKHPTLLRNLIDAEVLLATRLTPKHPLYFTYLHEVLEAIVSRGEVQQLEHHRSHNEISEVGEEIAIFLRPLAAVLPDTTKGEARLKWEHSQVEVVRSFRDAWFNMVVHGFLVQSLVARIHARELERIALLLPPLALELSWDRTETSLELNTVLRKGLSNTNMKEHKRIIGDIFEVPRTMLYAKLMFLLATVFVELLRVKTGDCLTTLLYLLDPLMKISGVDRYIGPIGYRIVQDFIYLVNCGANRQFNSDAVAEQLTKLMALTCFRIPDLQDAAFACCDLMVQKVPSLLAAPKLLFTLFDLLTVMLQLLIDDDIHQYLLTTHYRTKTANLEIKLSDQMSWRVDTFNRIYERAKQWLRIVLRRCAVDIKLLILQYLSGGPQVQLSRLDYGLAFALELAGSITGSDPELAHVLRFPVAKLLTLPTFVHNLLWLNNMVESVFDQGLTIGEVRERVFIAKERYLKLGDVDVQAIQTLLMEIAGLVLVGGGDAAEFCRYLVAIPFAIFEADVVGFAMLIWFAVIQKRASLPTLVISEVAKNWNATIATRKGLFSQEYDITAPEFARMEYAPSDMAATARRAALVRLMLEPHLHVIRLFALLFELTMNQLDHLLKIFTQFVEDGLGSFKHALVHPYARGPRFELIRFGFDVLNYHIRLGTRLMVRLAELVLDAGLLWFRVRLGFPYGSNQLYTKLDYSLLKEIALLVGKMGCWRIERLELKKAILLLFLDDEINKISVWLSAADPVETLGKHDGGLTLTASTITKLYALDPILAVNLALRYKMKNMDELLQTLIAKNPLPAVAYPEAVQFLIGIHGAASKASHHLLWWAPLAPIDAITLFLPPFGDDPYVLQYLMRSLELHDVNLTFFYVPQIVQLLRHDHLGYVERFIVETAQVSQLFAHQIIWNMKANSFKDEDLTEPDSLKPVLDRIQTTMLRSFSKKDLAYYELEFGFFTEVTSISGKLKPYIKKSKAEKKMKIDEEMARIEVKPGVYLPLNPDGVVIDINRKLGRPLQSHAKAPFMATFKIKKDVTEIDLLGRPYQTAIEKWQLAIFKVGDDCRQDVLALQLISMFRLIWTAAGLDLYVFPYRVTATAPGCGVIDVLPNSTSRDMMGREAVNGLYEYYISKFGPESLIEFQQARTNLIKSLAAYLIISFLLQFKDRHNGNIMYDDQGHVLHIDFGFCFDIVPGGVRFEAAPFKLTHEMMMVLGGSADTQAFKWFEDLCIKGFLACRPYMEMIVRTVQPMLESGLPCFKENSIRNLRKRFVPTKSEKEASLYFKGLIKKSMESFYTKGYDEFQRITNGIPY